MKNYIFLSLLGLSLAACEKADQVNNVVPVKPTSEVRQGDVVTPQFSSAVFGTNFTLDYQEQAVFRTSGQPELLVTLSDLTYTLCPKGAQCLVADIVSPTFNVTDAQGQTKQVKMLTSASKPRPSYCLDTTSVRANGRRYLISYMNWQVATSQRYAQKKDISVTLRVNKYSR